MRAAAAFEAVSALEFDTVLDIGSGSGLHADAFPRQNRKVTTISLRPPASIIADYCTHEFVEPFDCLWASHVLEHQPNPGLFLTKCAEDLKDNGILAVTVPPMKDQIVGGHVTLWNAGMLLYHLILAGFDCAHAAVKTYGYNVSVIVRKHMIDLPHLQMDEGDIERLAAFFPVPVKQGFDGRLNEINWQWQSR